MTDLENLLLPPWSRVALVNDETDLFGEATMTALMTKFGVRKNADGTSFTVSAANPVVWGAGANYANINFADTGSGYGFHWTTSGTAAKIAGIGVDAANSLGFLFSVKGPGAVGIDIDVQEANTTSDTRGLRVRQHSYDAPAAVFQHSLANTAPALQIRSSAVGSQHKAIMNHVGSDGVTAWFERIAKNGEAFQYARAHFGGSYASEVTRTSGFDFDFVSAEPRQRIYRPASSTPGAETWYPHRIETRVDELVIGSGVASATVDGSETIARLIRMKNSGTPSIAFLGASPRGRVTFAAATGTKTRTTFDSTTVTLPELAARVAALIDDLGATAGFGFLTA